MNLSPSTSRRTISGTTSTTANGATSTLATPALSTTTTTAGNTGDRNITHVEVAMESEYHNTMSCTIIFIINSGIAGWLSAKSAAVATV